MSRAYLRLFRWELILNVGRVSSDTAIYKIMKFSLHVSLRIRILRFLQLCYIYTLSTGWLYYTAAKSRSTLMELLSTVKLYVYTHQFVSQRHGRSINKRNRRCVVRYTHRFVSQWWLRHKSVCVNVALHVYFEAVHILIKVSQSSWEVWSRLNY